MPEIIAAITGAAPTIGAVTSIIGALNKGGQASTVAGGESDLNNVIRELLNRYMAQGQEFDPVMMALAKEAISSLVGSGFDLTKGKAFEGLQGNLISTIQNLMAQGGPDIAARLPQLARALGEQAVQSGAGLEREFAISEPERIMQALQVATSQSGRSLLPQTTSTLGGLANRYAQAGQSLSGDSGLADAIKNLMTLQQPTNVIPDLTTANPSLALPNATYSPYRGSRDLERY
jgi:hypothetical protein